MMTINPIGNYDPKRLITLKAISGLFFKGKQIKPGETFEVTASEAGDCLSTRRCDFANADERHLVYKTVEHF